jgi:hypothetical protein
MILAMVLLLGLCTGWIFNSLASIVDKTVDCGDKFVYRAFVE